MPTPAKSSTARLPPPEGRPALARARLGDALGFAQCPPAILDEMVAASTLRIFRRGEFVLRGGDPAEFVLMSVVGMLETSVLRLDGSRHLVGLLRPGDFNALISAIDGQEYINDCLARQDSVVMFIPIPVLRALREREPAVVLACELQLAYRSRLLYGRLSADPSVPLRARVASTLQTLDQLYGQPTEDGEGSEIAVSQTDLADWLGMSRQRVNFVLRQLQADGLIGVRYLSIRILDAAGLQASSER